uniref:Pentatricopeptide repeat-containing protein n=1 Tax=Populus davidiana TaxID=266767 RepID=A0A6M2F532_9ROSI
MIGHLRRIGVGRVQTLLNSSYKTTMEVQILTSNTHSAANAALPLSQAVYHDGKSEQNLRQNQIGDNVSKKDRIKFLITSLLDLNDSKDSVYGALDAWVAWEQRFPIASIKQVLIALEKEQQWHRIVQVIKWMLSKGQGTTMATYAQLIRALDMDHRAKEAHEFWLKKIGRDLHSVPWKLCNSMISIYYRNNMLENLIKVCFAACHMLLDMENWLCVMNLLCLLGTHPHDLHTILFSLFCRKWWFSRNTSSNARKTI